MENSNLQILKQLVKFLQILKFSKIKFYILSILANRMLHTFDFRKSNFAYCNILELNFANFKRDSRILLNFEFFFTYFRILECEMLLI